MGCGASSAANECAAQQLEAAMARWPAEEVAGAEERLGT